MISLTLWRSLTDAHGTRAELSWGDLAERLAHPAPRPEDAEHPKLGGWSPATFREDRRAKERVELVFALVLDVDTGAVPLEKVRAAFDGLSVIVHSTRRYTPEVPRWRVVVAVSRPMLPGEHALVWARERVRLAAHGIALDVATKDPSRFWFLPCMSPDGSYVSEVHLAEPIDVEAALVAEPMPIPVLPPTTPPAPAPDEPAELARISLATRRKRALAYVAHAEAAVSGQEGHKVAMRVASAVVRGFALGHAEALDVMHAWNAKCEPPWSGEELRHKVDEAARVGSVPWGKMLLDAPKPAPEPKKNSIELSQWNLLGARELFAPLPPIPWLCEAIRLAPGAVSLVAGYGYSRKTMALQSLALSVAAGRPVWGLYSCKRGRVVHLDYEQGNRLTRERYQRLARGMNIEQEELDDEVLRVACMPRLYLETQDAIDSLLPVVEGAALVVVDSLRAAFPHADENASEVRSYLDALNHLSERTGATVVVIHHARKPNAQNGGTATHAIRGSSALFDACQSVFVFEGEKDSPTTVHHQKDRVMGSTVPEFGLTSEDTPGPTGLRHGLVVRHLEAEQIAESRDQKTMSREERSIDLVAEKIVTFIAERDCMWSGSKRDLFALVRGNEKLFRAAWAKLEDAGIIVREGSQKSPTWRVLS